MHFDFGTELRNIGSAASPPAGFAAAEHDFIRDVLTKGVLLEDRHFPIARRILEGFLERSGYEDGHVVVLNGLPRHAGQAAAMAGFSDVRGLVVLDCGPDDVCSRIAMNTGNDRGGRTDDDPSMIKKKLSIFAERTAPLIDFYRARGAQILRVCVTPRSSAAEVAAACQPLSDLFAGGDH